MGIPAPLGVSASGKPPAGDQANAVLSGTFSAVGPSAPFAFRGPMNLALWGSYNTALTTAAGSLSATVVSIGAIAVGNAINSANVPKGTTVGTVVGTTITMKVPPIALACTIPTTTQRRMTVPDTTGLLNATVSGTGIPSGTTVTEIVTASVSGVSLGVVKLSADPTAIVNQPNEFYTFTRGAAAITVTGADAAATFTGAEIIHGSTFQLERSFDGGATFLPCNAGGQLAQFGTPFTPVSLTFGEPERQVLYRLNCLAYSAVSGVTPTFRISQTGAAAESLAIGQLT